MPESLADLASLQAVAPNVDEETGQARLDQASNLVRDEGDPEWDPATVPDRVADIVVEVARRALDNPGAHSQTSVGDVTVSYRGTGSQQDAVFLTKPERRAVRRAAGLVGQAVTLVSPWNGDTDAG